MSYLALCASTPTRARRRRVGRCAARRRRAVGRRRRPARRHAATEAPLYGEPGEPVDGLWPVNRLTALFARRRRPGAALAAARPRGAPARRRRTRPAPSPSRTGCARRRRSSRRSAIAERLWIVPSWCAPPDPGGDQPHARSGPRVRHRLAPDHAAVPRLAARRVCSAASACSTTAAARASWRSPPRSSAPAQVVGVDVDPQAIRASRANARANGVAAHVRRAR